MKACAAQGKKRIAYVAPTYQQARDIAWEELKRDLKDAGRINESRLEIRLVNDSLLVLRGWESIETLRGQKFDFIVLDEVAMMRDFWMKWQEVIRPTLTDTKGEGMFISTPKGFNHFYDLFNLQDTDDDFMSFHYTTKDNPFIPVEEIEKAEQELTEDRFAQEYLADFRKTEGLVYKEFNRKQHTVSSVPDENVAKRIAGVDFGYTNPAAVLEIIKDRDACYWIKSEWYRTGKTDVQIADYVAGEQYNEVYADPENPGGIAELEKRNVNTREVIKGKGSVQAGINSVRELFKANRLKIHKDCINLISELETYAYPEKKLNQNEQENPIKENDHAVDAMRYALMMDIKQNSNDVDRKLQQQFDINRGRIAHSSTR